MKTKSFYTAITTDKLTLTVSFYEKLGFHIAHQIGTQIGNKAVVLENDAGAKIDIIEITSEEQCGFEALRTNVDDLDAAIAELKEYGCAVSGPLEISSGRAILVKDPNGITINISQHEK